MLVLASVTDRLVDFATNVVGDLGIAGIFALMVPESACIPIPSEATILFAFVGKKAGDNWVNWKDSLHYVDYAVLALIVGGIAYLIVRARRRRRAVPEAA